MLHNKSAPGGRRQKKKFRPTGNLRVTPHYNNQDLVQMGNFKYTNSGMYNCYRQEQYSLSEHQPIVVLAYRNMEHAVINVSVWYVECFSSNDQWRTQEFCSGGFNKFS